MQRRRIIISLVAVMCILPSAVAASPAVPQVITKSSTPRTATQRLVERYNTQEPFGTAVWGVFARTLQGDTLACLNIRQKMVTASNMKLITTGCALHQLGCDYRFKTQIAYTGQITDGVLNGDLIIVGGGDPTTGAKDECSEPIDSTFSKWANIIKTAGIREITGRIIGDASYFDGGILQTDWSLDDAGTYYGVGPTGLNFFENAQHFSVTAGDKVGDRVFVWPEYPKTPWMTYHNSCTTSPEGNGDELYYVPSQISHEGSMRGFYAVDKAPKTLECSNLYPDLTCAYYFHEYLQAIGLKVNGGYANSSCSSPDSLIYIGSTYSSPISEIITKTNHESDNFYAETFMRTLGIEMHSSACYDSSRVAIKEVLSSLGLNPKALQIRDGSGLSRKNYVSPDFFVNYLTAMARTKEYDVFLHSLPQPGTGTLKYRFSKMNPQTKGRIFFKTGTLNGVRCYSGYILPSQGSAKNTIVFSIMTNNVTATMAQINANMDAIVTSLATER